MKDVNFYRAGYKFKSDVALFFKRYRVAILFLTVVFAIGVVAGILTASKYSGNLELGNIPDETLISFLLGNKSSFSMFFTYLIGLAIAVLAIIFLQFNSLTTLITYFYILTRGYTFGFVVFGFIALFSLSGIINAIIIIIPFQILLNAVLILICAICVSKNRIIKKYGRVCYNNCSPKPTLVWLCLLLMLILFSMCMVMPIIKITIIVN